MRQIEGAGPVGGKAHMYSQEKDISRPYNRTTKESLGESRRNLLCGMLGGKIERTHVGHDCTLLGDIGIAYFAHHPCDRPIRMSLSFERVVCHR